MSMTLWPLNMNEIKYCCMSWNPKLFWALTIRVEALNKLDNWVCWLFFPKQWTIEHELKRGQLWLVLFILFWWITQIAATYHAYRMMLSTTNITIVIIIIIIISTFIVFFFLAFLFFSYLLIKLILNCSCKRRLWAPPNPGIDGAWRRWWRQNSERRSGGRGSQKCKSLLLLKIVLHEFLKRHCAVENSANPRPPGDPSPHLCSNLRFRAAKKTFGWYLYLLVHKAMQCFLWRC